jgi:hypothetical protein
LYFGFRAIAPGSRNLSYPSCRRGKTVLTAGGKVEVGCARLPQPKTHLGSARRFGAITNVLANHILVRLRRGGLTDSRFFGNAVHEEMFKLVEVEQAAETLPKDLIVNKKVNGIGGRPDFSLPLGNSKYAVFDPTTKAQAGVSSKGHAGAKYADYDFVDYSADLIYEK